MLTYIVINKIHIINSNIFTISVFFFLFKNVVFIKLLIWNYENFIFISLKEPLLTLVLLDYELNQVNIINKLTNMIYQWYDYIPYIYEMEKINQNLWLLKGTHENDTSSHWWIDNNYDFEIILNLNIFEIEWAENLDEQIKTFYVDYKFN